MKCKPYIIQAMIIYKITNTINQKFYIGKFSRSLSKFKAYWGSGKILKRAIKKYGKEVFTKEIIDTADTLDELNEKEIYWINYTNAINDGYNLASGGDGGDLSAYINYDNITEKNKVSIKEYWDNLTDIERKARCSWLLGEGNPMYNKEGYWKNKKLPKEMVDKMTANRRSYIGEGNPNWKGGKHLKKCECGTDISLNSNSCSKCRDKTGDKNPFYGKAHTEETRKKISDSRKGQRPSNCKAFTIDDVEYYSLKDAEKQLGIKGTTIRHRIISKNKKYDNYKYTL